MKKQVSLFVPGRLCLFGEHTDWAGGYMAQNADLVEGRAIVTGINLGIYANATRSDVFEEADEIESAGYSKATKARLDGHKLQNLGWHPKYDVKSGIERTISILKAIQ